MLWSFIIQKKCFRREEPAGIPPATVSRLETPFRYWKRRSLLWTTDLTSHGCCIGTLPKNRCLGSRVCSATRPNTYSTYPKSTTTGLRILPCTKTHLCIRTMQIQGAGIRRTVTTQPWPASRSCWVRLIGPALLRLTRRFRIMLVALLRLRPGRRLISTGIWSRVGSISSRRSKKSIRIFIRRRPRYVRLILNC